MIKFILNNQQVDTDMPPGMLVLDFVRYHKNLNGTKIGCREGDCGACTVLIGELKRDAVEYSSFTSCLTPLANVHGKHVVTIEGINLPHLNPVQQAMSDCSATQCGFCTPGFVMSLAGFCLSLKGNAPQDAMAAIDGNICRCTGYKSIERAAIKLAEIMNHRNGAEPLTYAAENHILPEYFKDIKEKLRVLSMQLNGKLNTEKRATAFVGGGTDLYVQKHDVMKYADVEYMFDKSGEKTIAKEGDKCIIGSSVTVTDLKESPLFNEIFPGFQKHVKLVSSTPIRNMATIAGNFINASPIGDFTIFFLALNATVVFSDGESTREVLLRKLYKGYKSLDKRPEEFIKTIMFPLPQKNTYFNFEKVSKRTHLDIASVNTAMQITVEGDVITEAGISAGGVGPIPIYLEKSSSFLHGRMITEEIIGKAIEIVQTEISPISDARGTAEYKRLLLSQLIKAHFLTLFPKLEVEKVVHI